MVRYGQVLLIRKLAERWRVSEERAARRYVTTLAALWRKHTERRNKRAHAML